MNQHLTLLCGLLCCHILVLQVSAKSLGEDYEVVYPQKLNSHYKRDTRSQYPDVVQYKIQLDGVTLVLHLEKNNNLIAENYTETHYLEDGTPISIANIPKDHCFYHGFVDHDNHSRVSISTCNGLSGIIWRKDRPLIIKPLKQTDFEEHAVYPYKPLNSNLQPCPVTDTIGPVDVHPSQAHSSQSVKVDEQQDLFNGIKYVNMFMVADHSMFLKYDNQTEDVRMRLFEIMNNVNMIYELINVSVTLVGIEIWNYEDQIEVDISAFETLSRFSSWRKRDLLSRKPNDNAQFITNIRFNGSIVGLAYVSTMCSDNYSTGVIYDHKELASAVASTVAHELGHNLGMTHDNSSCNCSAETCIMGPSFNIRHLPFHFTNCSLQNFRQFLLKNNPQCLRNVPKKKDVQTPVCGNQFIERGEECDCGTVQECINPCCDAATCMLTPESQCSEGECCENCQIMEEGVVCRVAEDECKMDYVCDGKSAVCPFDDSQTNGLSFSNGQGYNARVPFYRVSAPHYGDKMEMTQK